MHNISLPPSRLYRTSTGVFLVLVWSSFSTPALKADDSAGANAAETTNAPVQLPTVVVTAQKIPQSLQTLPLSDTAVTKDTLDEAAVHYVNDAAIYAPNVFLNEFSARKLSNPFFRGIGSSPNNPGVTTYIDGVPQLNANSSSIELLDVNQIEFVRGPQAALYGRNTVGGIISITSTRPSLERWTGGLTGMVGNYNLWDVRASSSAPLIDGQLGLGVGFGFSSRDGYSKDDISGRDVDNREAFFGKGQLLWEPTENWQLRLLLTGERARDGDYALNDLAMVRNRPFHVARTFDGFTHRDLIAPTFQAHHDGSRFDFDMTTGLVWWETEDLTDLDYTPLPLITRDNKENDVQFSQEFRLASPKNTPISLADNLKLKWQTGLFVFTQHYEQDAVNSFGPGVLYQPGSFGGGLPPTFSPPNSQHSPLSKLDDVGVGIYGQGTLTAWEKLDLGIAVRGDYENKEADLRTFFTTPDPFLGPPTHVSAERDFTDCSPQFSLAYHLDPLKIAYFTVARGFKAGGFNSSSPAGQEAFGEEHSWNYELGLKTLWLDQRLLVNVAAFYIDWRDLQLNLPNPAVPGQFYIANVGGAASKGVELELRARAMPGLDFFGDFGFTDARFLSGTSNNGIDISGRKLPFTPDYNANVGAEYSLQVCSQAKLYARAEVSVYGDFKYDPANTAGQDTYSLANFRAGVRGSHWFAEGWVRNAFDTRYVPTALPFPRLAPSGFLGEPGAPLTFGLRAGVNF